MSSALESPIHRVKLDSFEGPLDLLLHLIRIQEIDIYDIPIARITEQYLQSLEIMKELNVNIAGEFLVMAATLIHIKSRMLLPPAPTAGEETAEEDPRQDLVERLLEYERFKKAAGLLHDRQIVESSVWERGEREFEEEEREAVSASLFDLVAAFHRIAERYRDRIVIQVEHENITLEEKLAELRALLKLRRELLFSSFFDKPISKLSLVLTFVALLEMAKLQELRLFQDEAFADIRIAAC